jgi:hypothetical protein
LSEVNEGKGVYPVEEIRDDCVYKNFPLRIVLFRAALLLGTFFVGGYLLAQIHFAALAGYLLYAAITIIATLAYACRNCFYHGRICDSGFSLWAARLFPERGERPRFTTEARKVIAPLLVLTMAPALGWTVAFALPKPSPSIAWLLIYVGLTVIWAYTTPRMACPHCAMNDICPLGGPLLRLFERSSES